MIIYKKNLPAILLSFFLFSSTCLFAQIPVSNSEESFPLKHGRQQFEQGQYALAIQSVEKYLHQTTLPTAKKSNEIADGDEQEAHYIVAVSKIKLDAGEAVPFAEQFIRQTSNPVYRQRVSFALAQYFFQRNDLEKAIAYYEAADIDNLSNAEIGDEKFELGYAYFNQKQFDKAKPLFATIKEMQGGKYYHAGNYYYGLLAYNDGDYDNALQSFDRIDNIDKYKDVVPYYRAEIYYFKGNYDKVLQIANRYLNKNEKLYYDKELHLLTAQTYFEQKQYGEALPYFEFYYDHSDRIRKEELYEMAYTYYRLEKWNSAIDKFKQLSDAKDSLGQTSMYLLGDCYLKTDDKKGARNAFGLCADMDFNTAQQEAASFLYAKLSYELGYETIATRGFNEFIKKYPNSQFTNESRILLTDLLSKSSNFAEAFEIISDLPVKDNDTWEIYQKVAVGRAIQLMQNRELSNADSIFSLSLQQPVNTDYEAIAYFWKSEIAYRQQRFPQTVQYANSFLSKAKNDAASIKSISPKATIQNAQMNIGFAQMEEDNYELAKQAFASAQTADNTSYNNTTSAEATLREADAAFMLKDFDRALSLYVKSISSGVNDPDYARIQQATILGLQNKNAEKIALLNQVIGQQPISSHKEQAEYELALTYLDMDRNQDAISLLKKLSSNESLIENIRSKAQLKLAYAYQDAGDNNEAITQYKKYITDYTSAPDRAVAIEALRNLYINTGQPQAFEAFIKEKNLPDVDASTVDNTYYATAENEYADNNYPKAIELFNNYLKQFPNGNSKLKAAYYLGESYYQTGDKTNALQYFDEVLNEGWSDFSENAAERAGSIALEDKDYQNAETYYGQLRDGAMQKANLTKAYRGLMIAGYELNNYSAAEKYADTLITLQEPAQQDEAQLFRAKAMMQEGNNEEALAIFKNLDKKNADAISAEARYYAAYVLLQQRKLKEAEDGASYAIQTASGNDYWLVKTYLLMADILVEEKDYFNAKATLQSVIKNTKDNALKTEANEKLEKVKDAEKQQSKLSEE